MVVGVVVRWVVATSAFAAASASADTSAFTIAALANRVTATVGKRRYDFFLSVPSVVWILLECSWNIYGSAIDEVEIQHSECRL
jgi:hypothetical protein